MAHSAGPNWCDTNGNCNLIVETKLLGLNRCMKPSIPAELLKCLSDQLTDRSCECRAHGELHRSLRQAWSYRGSLSLTETSLVFWLLIDVAIQLAGFIAAYIFHTEKFFDLLGSGTFFILALCSLIYGGAYHARQVVVTAFVMLWALRLGSFLFMRVLKTGKDSRFDDIKPNPLKFGLVWAAQALWVWVTILPLLILNGSRSNEGFRWSDIVGGAIWVTGFICELTADLQKTAFKNKPENKGRFINTGLWAYARYPNYFGEMTMWWGIWFMCIPAYRDGFWAAIVSPLFVMLLILKGSGVPMQEKQQKQRWGNEPAFQAWKRNANLFVPIPKFWAKTASESDDRMQQLARENDESSSDSSQRGR